MVSVCCEDCRTEKLKSKVFNKILINEVCNMVGYYLGCDYCSLTPEQQRMFKLVKSKPFPKTAQELQDIMGRQPYRHEKYYLHYFSGKRYSIFKDLYENFYSSHYMETQGLMKKQQLDTEIKRLKYFQKYDANENHITNKIIISTILGVFGYRWSRHFNGDDHAGIRALLQLNIPEEPTFLRNLKRQIKWHEEN